MSRSKDSKLYCIHCKKRPACTLPCYPVERLLDSITQPATETPIDYADQISEVSPNEVFVPSESWVRKSTKRKVFELCIIDRMTHQNASIVIGVTRQRVTQIASEILSLVDSL